MKTMLTFRLTEHFSSRRCWIRRRRWNVSDQEVTKDDDLKAFISRLSPKIDIRVRYAGSISQASRQRWLTGSKSAGRRCHIDD